MCLTCSDDQKKSYNNDDTVFMDTILNENINCSKKLIVAKDYTKSVIYNKQGIDLKEIKKIQDLVFGLLVKMFMISRNKSRLFKKCFYSRNICPDYFVSVRKFLLLNKLFEYPIPEIPEYISVVLKRNVTKIF